jgi:phosphopantothenoylcysteine decarboxylase/phosphopantothenate--cysteine ligase
MGRLPQPEVLLARVEAALPGPAGPWDGLNVLVTAGGTREAIDSVRFIGNRSSGRMGVALAEAAACRGADVALVAANVSLPISSGIKVVPVESAAELAAAAHTEFAGADVLLMAAAVADFRPDPTEGKLTREGSGGMDLRLTETEDVVAALSEARKPGQTLVGFAAEHGSAAISRAREKLERKGLDAIVFNDISRPEIGFDSSHNEVTIVTSQGERGIPESTKEEVAEAILDEVTELRGAPTIKG